MSEDRKSMWCPFTKEMCTNGWCPSMVKGKKKGEPDPKCRFWIKLTGKHPQKDEFIDEYDCSIAWLPTLMVEQCKIENSTGAAIESMRNRTADVAGALTQMTSAINSKPVVMLSGPGTIDTTTVATEEGPKGEK